METSMLLTSSSSDLEAQPSKALETSPLTSSLVGTIEPRTPPEPALPIGETAISSRIKRKRRKRPNGSASPSNGTSETQQHSHDGEGFSATNDAAAGDTASTSLPDNDADATTALKCAVCGERALGYV